MHRWNRLSSLPVFRLSTASRNHLSTWCLSAVLALALSGVPAWAQVPPPVEAPPAEAPAEAPTGDETSATTAPQVAEPPAPPTVAAAASADVSLDALRQGLEELEERFNILTTTDGMGFTPKDDDAEFALLEVQEGALAVDGAAYGYDRLRQLVGPADAERLMALTELSASRLQALRRPVNRDLEARLERIAELQAQRDRELAELEALRQELEAQQDQEPEEDDESTRYYTQDRFSFGNSLTIDERESTNDVVVIGGSLEIDGEVLGDAVVVGGGVEVQGDVHGDLTAVGGSISIGPDAVLNGEVTSVGGTIDDPYNRARGSSVQVELGPFDGFDSLFRDGDWWRERHDWNWGPAWGWHWGGIFLSLVSLAFFCLWLAFLTFLNRDYVASIAHRTEQEPWKSALVGLASQVLLLPLVAVISLILLISVIGIPVLVILLPVGALVLIVLSCYGYAGIATWSGQLLQRRFDWRGQGPFLLLLLGILIIEGWTVLGDALSGFGGPIQISAWLVLILGFVLQYIAWTMGFGTVVLMAFERGSRRSSSGGGWTPGGSPTPPPPPDREPGDFAGLALPGDGYGSPSDFELRDTATDADSSPDATPSYGSPDTWDDPFDTSPDDSDRGSDDARPEDEPSADADADADATASPEEASGEPTDDDDSERRS